MSDRTYKTELDEIEKFLKKILGEEWENNQCYDDDLKDT